MSSFRTLLWWLLLAAFGALAFELLSPDLARAVCVAWASPYHHAGLRAGGMGLCGVRAMDAVDTASPAVLAWHAWHRRSAHNRLRQRPAALHEGRMPAPKACSPRRRDQPSRCRAHAPRGMRRWHAAIWMRRSVQQSALLKHDRWPRHVNNATCCSRRTRATGVDHCNPGGTKSAATARIAPAWRGVVRLGRAAERCPCSLASAQRGALSTSMATRCKAMVCGVTAQSAHAKPYQQRWT